MSNYGWSCFLDSNFRPEPCVHLIAPASDPPTAPEDDNWGLSHKQGLSIAQKTDVILNQRCFLLHIVISTPVFFFLFHIILHFLAFLLQREEEEEQRDGRTGKQRKRSHFRKAFDSLLMRGSNTSLCIACK